MESLAKVNLDLAKMSLKEESKQEPKQTQVVKKVVKEEKKVPQEESKFDTAPVKTKLRPEDSQIWHGSLGNPEWPAPSVTFKSNEVARPGQNYVSMNRTEYRDQPEVVKAKVKLLAQMVKKS